MYTIASEVHGGESLWDSYLDLVTDPAHLLLELTLILIIDVIIGMVAWPFIKAAISRHDARKHPERNCDHAQANDGEQG